jgi:hypothetical protein
VSFLFLTILLLYFSSTRILYQIRFFAVPIACTVFGLVFFHIAAFGCSTFKEGTSDDEAGYWGYKSYHGACQPWDTEGLEPVIKFGRFIGVCGCLLIWAILVALVLVSCFKCPRPKLCFTIVTACMGVLSFFSFLLLSGLGLEGVDVRLSGGGFLAIVAAFIWAGGAVSMYFGMTAWVRRNPPVPVAKSEANVVNIAAVPSVGAEPESAGPTTITSVASSDIRPLHNDQTQSTFTDSLRRPIYEDSLCDRRPPPSRVESSL